MNKILSVLALFAVLITRAQTADDIINKYMEATGGHDKWSHVTSLKCTGTYTLGPGMEAPLTNIMTLKPALAWYSDFTWQGMTAKSVMRGDSGWTYRPFSGKRETDPMSSDEIRNYKLDADPQGLLVDYKAKGYTADFLGTDDVDGSDAFKVRITTPTGDMVYYYIDAETYYILKTEEKIRLKDKEDKSYTVFSDYRKTDYGVTVPFSAQRVDEQGNEQGGPVNYTKVEVNTNIDPSIFDRSKK